MLEAPFDYAASYEALVEFLYLAPVGIIKFSPDGVIEMANPAAAQLLMPLATDGDMSDLYRLLADIAPDLRSHVERFSADAGQICDQMQLDMPSKRTRLMLDINKIDNRTLMAAVQNITDLTEARRQVMRETTTQRLLASVFMGINAPVVVVRTDGFILMANLAFQTMLGYDAKSVLGLSIDSLLPPEYTGATRAAQSQQMLTGGCYETRMQIVAKSGVRSNVLMNSALLNERNQQQFRVITLIPERIEVREDGSKQDQARDADAVGPFLNQVRVVSLATFKDACGADWPFMESRAFDLAEELLKRVLGRSDVIKRGKYDNFVVWFSDADEQHISTMLERSQHGLRRLFTTDFGSKIATRVEAALAARHGEADKLT